MNTQFGRLEVDGDPIEVQGEGIREEGTQTVEFVLWRQYKMRVSVY